ncbi:cell division protein FtsW [Haematospirillum sp. H1815]|uniref:FtsW/RodA/SpoVE family cell cycle protein n=1 Tax=Haematospirillum sp. H1815 TaxID=2723108 RepID=UPI001439AE79|nr:putative peptidoglycan glycosyltransferase FtsW [Haematospirillum sp. H1815]NKD76717.1 cell division protein FtsW [Haematospirillum sp. H1815]
MTLLQFTRTDTSIIGRWWWTVDRVLLTVTLLLVIIGAILLMAAGPAAAGRIHAEPFHFVRRQFVFLPLAVGLMFAVSLLSPRWVRRVALAGFLASVALMIVAPFSGVEIKGATRWIHLGGLSIQPSEFLKPTFAIVAGWMFAEGRTSEAFPGFRVASALFLVVVGLLLIQPDFGQAMVVTAMWSTQFFLAGLSLFWVFLLVAVSLGGAAGAYLIFPHVQSRVDRFLNPDGGDTYQIEKALQAFRNGGIFGRGPGEGRVKEQLPDSHTDFIFAVAGEEFGVLLCLLIVGLFAVLVLRAMSRTLQGNSLFVLISVGGLAVQFGLQAIINMASSLHMMPTKGMTMPFVSYGGSSMLGLALGMGMVLALTRRHLALGPGGILP